MIFSSYQNYITIQIRRWELENNQDPQRQKEAFASLRPMMRDRPDLNRQPRP